MLTFCHPYHTLSSSPVKPVCLFISQNMVQYQQFQMSDMEFNTLLELETNRIFPTLSASP